MSARTDIFVGSFFTPVSDPITRTGVTNHNVTANAPSGADRVMIQAVGGNVTFVALPASSSQTDTSNGFTLLENLFLYDFLPANKTLLVTGTFVISYGKGAG
jgi:hypothetical protein